MTASKLHSVWVKPSQQQPVNSSERGTAALPRIHFFHKLINNAKRCTTECGQHNLSLVKQQNAQLLLHIATLNVAISLLRRRVVIGYNVSEGCAAAVLAELRAAVR